MSLKVEQLSFHYPGNQESILSDVSFEIEENQIACLVGASGSGKSTLLKCLGGFLKNQNGKIFIDGQSVEELATSERAIGFVFQDAALFDHINVLKNIMLTGVGREKALECLDSMGILDKAQELPHNLSGGQKQRVALARALSMNPKVIIFDEAFSSLDPVLRGQLRQVIKDILQEKNISALFITHDREDAMELAQRVLVLKDGKIVENALLNDILWSPKSKAANDFFQNAIEVDGQLIPTYRLEMNLKEGELVKYLGPDIHDPKTMARVRHEKSGQKITVSTSIDLQGLNPGQDAFLSTKL